jgi:hypothetical protein
MIPGGPSSGMRQRVRKTEQGGNALLHYLSTEAAMHVVRKDPELKRFYRRKLILKEWRGSRRAAKLGIRLWIMLRDQVGYRHFCRAESCGRKEKPMWEHHVGTPAFNSGPALQ